MPVRTIRVYLAYAEGDDGFRDRLIEEARKANLPVEFVYMPSKQPWVPRWKAACLARALECHGAIAAITRRTAQAGSMGAELDSVCEAAIPVLGVYVEPDPPPAPEQLSGAPLIRWSWPDVAAFIRSLDGDSLAAGGGARGSC